MNLRELYENRMFIHSNVGESNFDVAQFTEGKIIVNYKEIETVGKLIILERTVVDAKPFIEESIGYTYIDRTIDGCYTIEIAGTLGSRVLIKAIDTGLLERRECDIKPLLGGVIQYYALVDEDGLSLLDSKYYIKIRDAKDYLVNTLKGYSIGKVLINGKDVFVCPIEVADTCSKSRYNEDEDDYHTGQEYWYDGRD